MSSRRLRHHSNRGFTCADPPRLHWYLLGVHFFSQPRGFPIILLKDWARDPRDVERSRDGSGPERRWGATTPQAVGWMRLCKSKLLHMGRPLRHQEKGNIAGVTGLLGEREGGCEGQEGDTGIPPHLTRCALAPCPYHSNEHAPRAVIQFSS